MANENKKDFNAMIKTNKDIPKIKTWKHITFEQRKVISNVISQKYKLKKIAETIGFEPTSISKECKRNREKTTVGTNVTDCKKVNPSFIVCY